MTPVDWLIILAAAIIFVALGFAGGRQRARHAEERFAASRQLPWYLLGGSIAATALSTDTPLLVSGAFYENGLAGNWFWLAGVPGALATLFFFARYWRRSGVLTEVEILALRYGDSRATRWLRAASALFDAGLVNLLILSSVTYAAHLLVKGFFGFSDEAGIAFGAFEISEAALVTAGLAATTAAYTVAGGFRAVVRTDFSQLGLAIIGSLAVAYFALNAAVRDYSWAGLLDRIPDRDQLFNLFRFEDASIVLMLVFGWWQTAPGSGLVVQRLIAARSESDATLTTLLFVLLHYVLRAFPWFAIGALALVYFPNLTDSEQAFPAIAAAFLPAGGAGLLAVAFWAAFASTMDSRLNWAASYVANDVYGAFNKERGSAQAPRLLEPMVIIALAIFSAGLALSGALTSIIGIYKYLLVIQSGAALVAIARWYWWRVTIWAEIASFGASFLVGNGLVLMVDLKTNLGFATAIALNSLICGAVAFAVALWTSRKGPSLAAEAFNARIRVVGPGWRKLGLRDGKPTDEHRLRTSFVHWALSVVLVYGCIVLISSSMIGDTRDAAFAGLAITCAGAWLWLDRRSLLRALQIH